MGAAEFEAVARKARDQAQHMGQLARRLGQLRDQVAPIIAGSATGQDQKMAGLLAEAVKSCRASQQSFEQAARDARQAAEAARQAERAQQAHRAGPR